MTSWFLGQGSPTKPQLAWPVTVLGEIRETYLASELHVSKVCSINLNTHFSDKTYGRCVSNDFNKKLLDVAKQKYYFY